MNSLTISSKYHCRRHWTRCRGQTT